MPSKRMSTVRTLLQLGHAGSPSPPRYTTCQKVTLVHYKERCVAIEGVVLPCKRAPRFCCKCCTAPHCQRRECVASEKKPCNYKATCTLTKNAMLPGQGAKNRCTRFGFNLAADIGTQSRSQETDTFKSWQWEKMETRIYTNRRALCLLLCMTKGESWIRKFSRNINTLFPPGAVGNLRET